MRKGNIGANLDFSWVDSMNIYTSTRVGVIALGALFVLFIYFGTMADHAMTKDGVGNLIENQIWNARAGFAFWSAAVVWASLVVFALLRQGAERSQLLFVCGLSVVLAPAIFTLWLVCA
jgi:hypothetical protein